MLGCDLRTLCATQWGKFLLDIYIYIDKYYTRIGGVEEVCNICMRCVCRSYVIFFSIYYTAIQIRS